MQYNRDDVRISRRSPATAGLARHSFSSVFVAAIVKHPAARNPARTLRNTLCFIAVYSLMSYT
jgi:hypothetical protein